MIFPNSIFISFRYTVFSASAKYLSTYSIVKPGKVSKKRKLPSSIIRPPYANFWGKLPKKTPEIEIKNENQIRKMRNICSIARDILLAAGEKAVPGVTTDDIDSFVHNLCIEQGVYPSPLDYRGFPKSVCTSVNNVACHGIPDDRQLLTGDIVNIDITVYKDGYHGDTSSTYYVGRKTPNADTQRLLAIAKKCRDEAISICGPRVPYRNIGRIISNIADNAGMEIVMEFCGHGIGSHFHTSPDIYHVENDEPGLMQENTTFTIEPIIADGDSRICILSDKWTAVTLDACRSAQFEHTILITSNGSQVLT